jgi:UPF0755 protein
VRRRLVAVLTAVLAVTVLAGLVGSALAWSELNRPYAGWTGQEPTGEGVVVILERGEPAATMIHRLARRGVIRSPRFVRIWLRLAGDADRLHAGEYRFDSPLTPLEVIEKLRSGKVLLHSVTIPEGLSLRETAARLAGGPFGEEDKFLQAMGSPDRIADLDPEAEDLEGYLFPDTYHFPRTVTEMEIVTAMVDRFREVTGESYAGEISGYDLSLRQAVTLASLIEKETSVPDERKRISQVFHNRLRLGMKLQCDPTVIYALRRDGLEVGRLTYKDLEYPSRWNTYHVSGLPPGPIANPGRESLWAAVHPVEGKELYFVAAPGGGHRFSTRLDDHLRAVREYRAWIRSSQGSR